MQLLNTNKISAADGIKAVVYGKSGVGKTMLIATAPSPFIFSAEKGLLSLRKSSIVYTEISTFKELTDAYDWATKSSEAKKFDTFALDSLSEIAEIVLAQELKQNKDPRKAYGNMQQSMYGLIRSFRDMKGKNVVFVAKQMLIEEGQPPVITKRMSPIMPSAALQNQTPYFFDLILHMSIETYDGVPYRVLQTGSTAQYDAKDRSGNLDAIERPDLSAIFKKVLL